MEVSLFSLFSVILLFLYPRAFSAFPPNLDLCNLFGDQYVTPELCHSVVDTDPQSRTADLLGLGIIASEIAARNATSVAAEIQKMLSNASNANQTNILNICVKLYTDVVPVLNGAAESMKVKNYSAAETGLYSALTVPEKCDDALTIELSLWGVVTHYNNEFTNVVFVAHAIAAYIERYGA